MPFGKSEIISDILSRYSMQYMLDSGSFPSRETVTSWMSKLDSLDEGELMRIGGDLNSVKRFLSARGNA